MFKRKTLARTIRACAVVGFAAAGCEYNDQYGEGPPDTVEQVTLDRGFASAGEATPTQVIALSQPATETMDWLTVDSKAFAHNGAIPERFTGYGKNDLPELNWSDVPRGTQSFAVIVEDPDSAFPRPFVHLILYNIPASQRGIKAQDVSFAQSSDVSGMTVGRNSSGMLGYVAPAPPSGEAAHTYHFQVFALDAPLSLPPGADKQAVLDAMKGHVLAKGETIGTYQRP